MARSDAALAIYAGLSAGAALPRRAVRPQPHGILLFGGFLIELCEGRCVVENCSE